MRSNVAEENAAEFVNSYVQRGGQYSSAAIA